MGMAFPPKRFLLAFLAVTLAFAAPAIGRTLSFEERVRAQEAIERVYHRHQQGTTRPFEEAVPRDLLESKVRDTLRKSLALERIWHVPITATTLRRETERMATSTRLPARLEEIYDALGRDRFLFEETVARAAVAERMTRSFASSEEKQDWDAFDENEVVPVSMPKAPLPAPRSKGERGSGASCLPDDSWDNASLDAMPGARTDSKSVWTGSEMIVWGGITIYGNLATGGRYDPATDTWRSTSLEGAPAPRSEHTAIWTGSRMIVWGGKGDGVAEVLASGGAYDPAADAWTSLTLAGAPAGRAYHTAVWTGTRMIVWGGLTGTNVPFATGGAYDPVSDQWTATSVGAGVPEARGIHAAVWTGSLMIVWGGWDGGSGYLATGARYDPAADSWTALPAAGSLAGRYLHTAVWTGSRMIVWGGLGAGVHFRDGARYDPVANAWTATKSSGAPAARHSHTAVWTGSRMIVWGGVDPDLNMVATGGSYDPAANAWTATATSGAPAARYRHDTVWADGLMIVWGGTKDGGATHEGGRYDPVSDAWTPTSLGGPSGRQRYTVVWTGNRMIVWGGDLDEQQCTATGSRYDPALDTWSETTLTGSPAPRYSHSAVWSGDEMIVWGGWGCGASTLGTGGRYDPVADSWTPVGTTGAPEARDQHSAIWTGSRMIVWGGVTGSNAYQRSGGIYDPGADTWTPTDLNGAPPFGRSQHSAIWTGTRMLIWGGSIQVSPFHSNTGGLYDPVADAWTATTLTGAPTVRSGHDTVWTGTEMIVWGGLTTGGILLGDGFRYDPASDTWTRIATSGAPTARSSPSSVWTGREMLLWGGIVGGDTVDTGFRYDPQADAWTPMTTQGAPPARTLHTAVWTGSFMIPWGGVDSAAVNTGGRYAIDNAVDLDGDGLSSCDGDCNDADPGAFAVPGEILGLFASDPQTFSWQSGAGNAGAATVHDVVRGLVADLPVGSPGEACLASGIAASSVTDPEVPAAGSAFFYLVRARNSCGDGGYGLASSGAPRITNVCP